MKNKKPIITIDGPSASGKGTVSKALAKTLKLKHLETGLFYRRLAIEYLRICKKQNSLKSFLNKLDHDLFNNDYKKNKEIYTRRVTEVSSLLAKKKTVREFVVRIQKDIIKKCPPNYKGLILEGRDCGTIIAPNADVKIFLTANLEIRAMRRFEQIKTSKIILSKVLSDLSKRDERDTKRKYSPLIKPKDSFLVDSSKINFLDTINIVKKIIFSKIPNLEK